MTAASELIPTDPPKPAKKKRKARKRAKPAAKAAAKPGPDLGAYAGITSQACPKACNLQMGCYITRGGSGICAHPRKGGLQSVDSSRSDVVIRYGEARKILEHDAVEKRGG
jgi:hypothetical protein